MEDTWLDRLNELRRRMIEGKYSDWFAGHWFTHEAMMTDERVYKQDAHKKPWQIVVATTLANCNVRLALVHDPTDSPGDAYVTSM